MRLQQLSRLSLAFLALLVSACGSSDPAPGRLNVRLVDGPGDYAEVNLDVQRVEIHANGEWRTLGTPDVTVNLLTLVDGVAATLVEDAVIDAGRYTQLRLVLGPQNSVRLRDGSLHDLKVPSGMRSGVKLTTSFDVAPNTTADLFIDLDAHRSIFVHRAGNSSKYILRPTVRAVDRVVTGAITGTLSGEAGALAGVQVTAQAVDAAGTPTILRSATTRADGSYVLDLLPVGGAYHVVAQPVVRDAATGAALAAYAAQASGAIPVTASSPTPTFDATFAPVAAAALGSISGTVTLAAVETEALAEADTVSVLQVLDAGGTPRALVVRTTPGEVVSGVERYAVDALPAGTYAVTLERTSVDAAGGETVRAATTPDVVVVGGADLVLDLTAP